MEGSNEMGRILHAALVFCVAAGLADGQTAGKTVVISARHPVTIVIPKDADPPARRGAQCLAGYIGRVTGAAPTVTADGTTAPGGGLEIVLRRSAIRDFRPDGYRIVTASEEGRDVVSITAPASAGLKYGSYRLIREMAQEGREIRLAPLALEVNPWLKTRELFVDNIEWRPTPGEQPLLAEQRKQFDWANWDVPALERYIDLIDAMGYNSLMLMDTESVLNHTGRLITRSELTRKVEAMYAHARSLGMGTAFFLWGQEGARNSASATNCPRIPEEFADMKANWEYLIAHHGPSVDRWVLHWADPGGCSRANCTVHTPQVATIDFASLLRQRGFSSDVSFSLWAMHWATWPGYVDDRTSVVDAGVLPPDISINLMRYYKGELALAIRAKYKKTGVWGWYMNDFEVCPSLHVHTRILENEFHRLHASASTTLDWYSLEDNNHILNLPSVYAGAQFLWDSETSADRALHEFCEATWGRQASKIERALRAIAEVRCGPGIQIVKPTHKEHYLNDYMCWRGRGSALPQRDLAICERALQELQSVAVDESFVPKLPLPVAPGKLLEYIRAHLRYVADFARLRVAYNDALRPAIESARFVETQKRMETLPALSDVVQGAYGAYAETFHHGILRTFGDTWKGRVFHDNLALKKRVTASSTFNNDPRFGPDHAVNGILCEFNEEGWAADGNGPAWLKIDLGSTQPVRSVRLYNRGYRRDIHDNNLSATSTKAQVFSATVDPDPSRGTLDGKESGYALLGGFDNWAPTNDPSAYQEIKVVSPVKARFIKVLIYSTADDQPAGCGEVEVR